LTRISLALFSCFYLMVFSGNLWAQSWKKDPKIIMIQVGASTTSSSEQFDHDGKSFEIQRGKGDVGKLATDFRLEYNPVKDLGLFIETEFKSITFAGEAFEASVSGFGDIRFGAGYVLTKKKSPVGAVLGLAITSPTGYSPDLGDFVPVLGQGVNVYGVFFQLGKRFKAGIHLFLESGYRLSGSRAPRGGGPKVKYSDQIPVKAQLGYWVQPNIRVSAALDARFSLSDPEKIDNVEFVNRAQSYTSLGLESEYVLNKKFHFSGKGMLDLIGRNRLLQTTFMLSIGVALEVGN